MRSLWAGVSLAKTSCASTAWACTFLVEHNWVAALYPEQAQEQFFAKGRYFMAPATSTPPGQAVRVPGGYKLNGQWKWGSGVMHCDWCIGQAFCEVDGKPAMHWMAFPLSEATVLDTWYVQGLRATGSNDIMVRDLFVPEHITVRSADMQFGTTPGSKIHDNPMYRMPSTGFLALVTSAPAIGAARGAVAAAVEQHLSLVQDDRLDRAAHRRAVLFQQFYHLRINTFCTL